MSTPHFVHLLIVGLIFLLVLGILGAVLRHFKPKTWWLYLIGMVVASIVAPVLLGFLV